MPTIRDLQLRDYPDEQQKIMLEEARRHYEEYKAGRQPRLPSQDSIVFRTYQEFLSGVKK